MGKAGARPRGPAPKPTKMKVLHGTNRADRGTPNEMDPKTVVMLPPAPSYFDEAAKKVWEVATRTLRDLNMLVEVDYHLLQSYCHQMSLVERCSKEIKKKGLTVKFTNKRGATNEMASPLVKIHNDALNIAKALAAQFGFTPSARTRISATKTDDSDGFDDF